MKLVKGIVTLVMLFALSTGIQAQNTKKVQTTTFECNIDCHSCEKKIMTYIPYEKGVKDVDVDVDNKQVTIKYKTKKNNDDNLIKAFKKIGFEATVRKGPLQTGEDKK